MITHTHHTFTLHAHLYIHLNTQTQPCNTRTYIRTHKCGRSFFIVFFFPSYILSYTSIASSAGYTCTGALRVKYDKMHSADTLDDDQWWLESDGLDEGSVTESRKVSNSKKNQTIEQPQETFDTLHTPRRQRKEFLAALKRHQITKADDDFDKTTIKKSNFIDCSTLESSEVPQLCDLVVFACDPWKKLVKRLQAKGSPLVMVFSASALREVEMRRELVELAKPYPVAKLFAKHMKVDQQSGFLTSHITPIAVATPERAQKLLEMGSLNLTELKLIVLDWYWRDVKMRRFSEIPEVWSSYLQLHRKIQKVQPGIKVLLY